MPLPLPEIVGTIAGEDTIFIAVRDAKVATAAIKEDLGIIWENTDKTQIKNR